MIVDPSVASEEDELLFPATHYADERRHKSGWMSLFGRPRQEASGGRAMAARSTSSAQPALEPLEDADAHEREDLEIPSFLRRLAN
jgi:cell division protein FtsZ